MTCGIHRRYDLSRDARTAWTSRHDDGGGMRTTADVCRRSFLVHARGSGGDADIRAARDDRGRPRADGGDDRARAARIQLCQGDDVCMT